MNDIVLICEVLPLTERIMKVPDTTLNPDLLKQFENRMLDVMNHAAIALMISVGHRTKLFDVLALNSPASSQFLAEKSGLTERYIREWLGAMVTGSIVTYDPQSENYHLPKEHVAFLSSLGESGNCAASLQWIAELASIEDKVVDAFEHGRGIPYSEFRHFHSIMAEKSIDMVVGKLLTKILPLVAGLNARLNEGVNVMDVGCGSGRAVNFLASEFPRSCFFGIDVFEPAVKVARDDAASLGLANVGFKVQDASLIQDEHAYDLITAFDAIHDQAQPATVLLNIFRALKPDGVFLMQEIALSGSVAEDIKHPLGPFLYAISCMHCVSVSLAMGGPGLGATWGAPKAVAMLREAGFTEVRIESLPHDKVNRYFVCNRSS